MSTRDLRLSIASRENGDLATVTAEAYAAPGPGAELLGTLAVHTYWHTPEDGSDPYVVVEVDAEEDSAPFRIYVNDGPVPVEAGVR